LACRRREGGEGAVDSKRTRQGEGKWCGVSRGRFRAGEGGGGERGRENREGKG